MCKKGKKRKLYLEWVGVKKKGGEYVEKGKKRKLCLAWVWVGVKKGGKCAEKGKKLKLFLELVGVKKKRLRICSLGKKGKLSRVGGCFLFFWPSLELDLCSWKIENL